MTRYEKYIVERDWNQKIQQVEEKMKYRKELYSEKVRNKIYGFGLFLFGIVSVAMTKDITLAIFAVLGLAICKESSKFN